MKQLQHRWKKTNGLACMVLAWDRPWSESQISDIIMFGHAKDDGGFKEMFDALEKLAVPLRLMLPTGMDAQNVNKSVVD